MELCSYVGMVQLASQGTSQGRSIHATYNRDSYSFAEICQFPRAVSPLPSRPGVGGSCPDCSSFQLVMIWSGEGHQLG